MRQNMLLAATATFLLVAVAVGYVSGSARIAELEARVEELDRKVIAVTTPMETLREDISSIYTELDDIQATVADESGGGSRQDGRVAQRPRPAPRRVEYRLLDSDYPDSQSGYVDPAVQTPYGTERPTHRSFYVQSDEDS